MLIAGTFDFETAEVPGKSDFSGKKSALFFQKIPEFRDFEVFEGFWSQGGLIKEFRGFFRISEASEPKKMVSEHEKMP